MFQRVAEFLGKAAMRDDDKSDHERRPLNLIRRKLRLLRHLARKVATVRPPRKGYMGELTP